MVDTEKQQLSKAKTKQKKNILPHEALGPFCDLMAAQVLRISSGFQTPAAPR
jgi:hypothetical protein